MAKKQETKPVAVEETVTEQETMEAINDFIEVDIPRERLKPSNEWEIKDRMYILKDGKKPLSRSIKAADIFYFDEEKGYEREILLTENQNTPFVDEFKGQVRPGRIIFRNGVLFIPRNKIMAQKVMSIYHPSVNKLWEEDKPKEVAVTQLENLDHQLDAMIAARTMDIDTIEAIMRTEVGSKVTKMTSKELKRDILILAKERPSLVLSLMEDDNIHLRNIGIKAVEQNILSLSGDQRTLSYTSNGRKLMNIPFEEHPYSAIAAWFKTDEGMEILKTVEKQLV